MYIFIYENVMWYNKEVIKNVRKNSVNYIQ
jgi:hypothetical protein